MRIKLDAQWTKHLAGGKGQALAHARVRFGWHATP